MMRMDEKKASNGNTSPSTQSEKKPDAWMERKVQMKAFTDSRTRSER